MATSRRVHAAYVRPGNACAEALRAGPGAPHLPDGGPDLYTASFLRFTRDVPSSITAFTNLECAVTVGNTDVRCLRLGEGGSRAARLLDTLWVLLRFFFRLARRRPTHLYCFLIGPPQWAARLAALVCGSVYVQSLHNTVTPPARGGRLTRFMRGLDRRVIRSAHRVICHEAYLENQVLNLGVPRERIIRYEAGYEAFAALAREQERRPAFAGPDDVLVLFASRLTRDKGAFDLLEAAQSLCPRLPRLKIAFAGKDTDGQDLVRAIAKAGLQDRVHYLGFQPRDALAGLVQASDVVVTPTRSHFPEGRCMTMAEALVLGKPVVAPRFEPFSFYLRHEVDSLLFTPDSPEDLSRQLGRMLDDSELLDRLRRGAAQSGQSLLRPRTTYLQALQRATLETGGAWAARQDESGTKPGPDSSAQRGNAPVQNDSSPAGSSPAGRPGGSR